MHFKETIKAVNAAHEDAKKKGFGKGHAGQSEVKCPICLKGMIKYSVASYNGHIWGTCTTEGCARWME